MGLLEYLKIPSFEFLKDYFRIPSEKENREHEKQLVKRIIMRYSRELALSRGAYITQEDHERMKQEAKKYKF